MRTLAAGIEALRRAPVAILPMTVEGIVAGVLVAIGVLPNAGAGAAAVAVFPMDVFFDLKHWLAAATSWQWFAVAMVVAVATRAGVLTATLWLVEGAPGPFLRAWFGVARVAGLAMLALTPSAVLIFSGVALRYAPFVWLGGVAGFAPALVFARRGVRIDVGGGEPGGRGVPEGFAYLSYAYLLSAFAAAMSTLAGFGSLPSALILVCTGPLNALFLLGWRESLRAERYPGGGALAVLATVVVTGMLLAGTVYDRFIRSAAPIGRVASQGSLFLLSGVDSAFDRGPLGELNVREVGFREDQSTVVSYTGPGTRHRAEDTHEDLATVAAAVSEQFDEVDPPRFLLGHSQAALILDRLLARGPVAPSSSAMMAPPPPFPPPVEVPAPRETGRGKPGGDAARAAAAALDLLGFGFELDAPASPTRLRPVVVIDAQLPRLSIWALGDSVWLDRDWRRPGEVNLVAVTDHVGVTNDPRALTATRDFFAGRRVDDDESSWRGFLVALLRYGFEPWRPTSGAI